MKEKKERDVAALKERKNRHDEHRRHKRDEQNREEEKKKLDESLNKLSNEATSNVKEKGELNVAHISIKNMTENGVIKMNGVDFEILDTFIKEKKKIEDKDHIYDYYAADDGVSIDGEGEEMEDTEKTTHNYSRKYDIFEANFVDEDGLDQSSNDGDDSNRESNSENDYPEDDQVIETSDEEIAGKLETKFVDKFMRKNRDFGYSNTMRQSEKAYLEDYEDAEGPEYDIYIKEGHRDEC